MKQVFIKVNNDKTYVLDIYETYNIKNIKYILEKKSKIPMEFQTLIFNAKILKNFNYNDFSHGDSLFCNIKNLKKLKKI